MEEPWWADILASMSILGLIVFAYGVRLAVKVGAYDSFLLHLTMYSRGFNLILTNH